MDSKNKKNIELPSFEQVEAERNRIRYSSRYRKALMGTVNVLLAVAAVAVLVSSLVMPVLHITGDSMVPNINNDDIVVLMKTDRFETGDICGFSWNNRTLLKRVIGVAGDWIVVDDDGNVFVNGEKLDEPYVKEKDKGKCDLEFPYQVPEKSLFLMGDHRSTSVDSRSSVMGSVKCSQAIGKVVFRVWPPGSIGSVN